MHVLLLFLSSLGITLLELASDLDLPRGGDAWHQLRNGQLPDVFTQGLLDLYTPGWSIGDGGGGKGDDKQ